MGTTPMSQRSQDRRGTRVIWIALHTSEGTSYDAAGLRDAAWWVGSSHAISDTTTLLDHRHGCVHPDRASWTLRDGNNRSVNIEQVGMAEWSRDTWLTRRSQLELTARWIADMSKRFDIPITYVGIDGVRDRRPGVIQHNDYTVGAADGDHWDCGPGYPIAVVIELAREIAAGNSEEDDMFTADDREMLIFLRHRVEAMLRQRYYVVDQATGKAREVTRTAPGAKPCTVLDSLDGNLLVRKLAGLETDVDSILNEPEDTMNDDDIARIVRGHHCRASDHGRAAGG